MIVSSTPGRNWPFEAAGILWSRPEKLGLTVVPTMYRPIPGMTTVPSCKQSVFFLSVDEACIVLSAVFLVRGVARAATESCVKEKKIMTTRRRTERLQGLELEAIARG
jgi:hypothetical protein